MLGSAVFVTCSSKTKMSADCMWVQGTVVMSGLTVANENLVIGKHRTVRPKAGEEGCRVDMMDLDR